jgi:hypothetical protein
MAVNAQFTVGERFKGKRTGRSGLYLFALMHYQDNACIEIIAGNRQADALLEMHPALLATFASF